MQSLVEKNILNTLKLRASYGETGLDEDAGRFQCMTTLFLRPVCVCTQWRISAGI